MKKILGVSLVALMAVNAAHANIASEAWVNQKTGDLTNLNQDLSQTNLVAAINSVATTAAGGQTAQQVSDAITTALANGNDAYQTASDVNTTLADYYTETEADDKFQTLANLATTSTWSTDKNSDTKYASAAAVEAAAAAAVTAATNSSSGTLVTHTANTAIGSTSVPVYIQATGVPAVVTVDASPISASANPVQSGGVYSALADKQDKVIGATNGDDANKVVVVNASGEISKSSTTIGTAAGATVETTGVASDTTTLPTTAQVKSYVDTAVSNSAINSVSLGAGTANGTVQLTVDGVAGSDVAVTGLGSAAYTASTDYIPVSSSSTGSTGTQVLTRVSDGQGGYTYMWETIIRAGS